jgi:hypothetical protein
MNRYAALMASEMQKAGRHKGLGAVILNPLWRFFRGMIIKRGYLDGWRGLAFHVVEARYVQEKYLRMWLDSHLEGRSFVRGHRLARPSVEAGATPETRATIEERL